MSRGNTVWVGNLPFEVTEAELNNLMSSAGPVKNLRLVMDRETGRPKGFGFCEYFDKATAESAHRNLSGSEFLGRTIRVDFAQEEFGERKGPRPDRDGRPPERDRDREPPPPRALPPIGYAAAAAAAAQVASLLGGPPSNDRRVQEQLNDLLASKSKPELWDCLRMLKDFLGPDRGAAKAYFSERPGLAKAVFQAQVLLGMVKPVAAAYGPPSGYQEPPRIAAGGPLGLQVPPGAVVQQPGPMTQVVMVDPTSGQPQTVMVPAQQLGALGVAVQQPVPQVQLQPLQPQPDGMLVQQAVPQVQLAQAPMQHVQLAPAPVAPAPQQVQLQQAAPPSGGGGAAALGGQDPAQMQTLLRQVVTMTDEQINALPDQFRQQVLFVKEQIRLGHVRVE